MKNSIQTKDIIEEILNKYKKYININYNNELIETWIKQQIKEIGGTKFLGVKSTPLHIDKAFELMIIDYILSRGIVKGNNKQELLERKNKIEKKAKMQYNYGERLGKNSVSVIIYDPSKEKYGLIQEIKPPLYKEGVFKVTTAAGGSIDKSKSYDEIVMDEIKEEFGYDINSKDLIFVGKSMATPQMSEINNMYLCNIENAKKIERNLEEGENSEVVWLSREETMKVEDSKVGAIINLINDYARNLLLKINELELLELDENPNKQEIDNLKNNISDLMNDKLYSFLNLKEKNIIKLKYNSITKRLDEKINRTMEITI